MAWSLSWPRATGLPTASSLHPQLDLPEKGTMCAGWSGNWEFKLMLWQPCPGNILWHLPYCPPPQSRRGPGRSPRPWVILFLRPAGDMPQHTTREPPPKRSLFARRGRHSTQVGVGTPTPPPTLINRPSPQRTPHQTHTHFQSLGSAQGSRDSFPQRTQNPVQRPSHPQSFGKGGRIQPQSPLLSSSPNPSLAPPRTVLQKVAPQQREDPP